MYKLKLTTKTFLTFGFSLAVGAYIFLLSILPVNLYKLGLADFFGEIFPAIDIMLIYYFSSYKNIKYWVLFLLGIIIDQIYQIPIGTSSLAFILGKIILTYAHRWIAVKEEVNNILIFAVYSLFIIGVRYLVLEVNYKYNFVGISIYFYYLTTVVSYPIIRWLTSSQLKVGT